MYVDSALPFGLRSAPVIFNVVADALAFMICRKGIEGLDHYLDDFINVTGPSHELCKRALSVALQVCDEVGCPISNEKTEGPATVITLLGVGSRWSDIHYPKFRLIQL